MGRLFLGLTVFSAILLVAATFLFVLLLPVQRAGGAPTDRGIAHDTL